MAPPIRTCSPAPPGATHTRHCLGGSFGAGLGMSWFQAPLPTEPPVPSSVLASPPHPGKLSLSMVGTAGLEEGSPGSVPSPPQATSLPWSSGSSSFPVCHSDISFADLACQHLGYVFGNTPHPFSPGASCPQAWPRPGPPASSHLHLGHQLLHSAPGLGAGRRSPGEGGATLSCLWSSCAGALLLCSHQPQPLDVAPRSGLEGTWVDWSMGHRAPRTPEDP